MPLPSLVNPRHDLFASLLARGASPVQAYFLAGYSPKNRKSRAAALAAHPEIQARVTLFRSANPSNPNHATDFLSLPPPNARGINLWLSQVATGAIPADRTQVLAATEFVRLQEWRPKRRPRRLPPPSRNHRPTAPANPTPSPTPDSPQPNASAGDSPPHPHHPPLILRVSAPQREPR